MPHITTLEVSHNYRKFVVEPLERGYGQTIGNALRRVMLSSIQGAAVSAVRIDKVFHEFDVISWRKGRHNTASLEPKGFGNLH